MADVAPYIEIEKTIFLFSEVRLCKFKTPSEMWEKFILRRKNGDCAKK